MDEIEQKFLDAIAADPDDAEARSVYADWLDERGDLRGEYLRLELQLRTIPLRLAQIVPQIDPEWLGFVGGWFDILLRETGPMKISVIKVVREITGLGLKDSKDLVESTPRVVKQAVTRSDANELIRRFEGTGAKVDVVPTSVRPLPPHPHPPGSQTARVVLERVDPSRMIDSVKLVREITGLGLKDSKDIVDGVIAGRRAVIAKGLHPTQASELIDRLREIGDAVVDPET